MLIAKATTAFRPSLAIFRSFPGPAGLERGCIDIVWSSLADSAIFLRIRIWIPLFRLFIIHKRNFICSESQWCCYWRRKQIHIVHFSTVVRIRIRDPSPFLWGVYLDPDPEKLSRSFAARFLPIWSLLVRYLFQLSSIVTDKKWHPALLLTSGLGIQHWYPFSTLWLGEVHH